MTVPMGWGRVVWITLVTLLFPGFGQALFSRRAALAWLVAMLAAIASLLFVVQGVYVVMAVWLGNVIDVIRRLVAGRTRALPHPAWNVPIAILVANIVVAGALKTQLQSFQLPSSSMSPTIAIGDRIVVSKLGTPGRGDIVVFRQPCGPQRIYIARLVAVAGDTVEVACGRLYLNGVATPSTLVDAKATYADTFEGSDGVRSTTQEVARYRETIGDTTFDVFRLRPEDVALSHDFPALDAPPPSCANDGGAANPDQAVGELVSTPGGADPCAPARHLVVPKGSLFVLGDNRDNSNDSRYWGVVPASYVVGTTVGVFWPLGRMQNL